MKQRKLTAEEINILKIIQQEYGSQNTEKDVFFTDNDEAAIFVKASDGTTPVMVVLTNLAAWRKDGTITSDDELRNEWLRAKSNQVVNFALLNKFYDFHTSQDQIRQSEYYSNLNRTAFCHSGGG